ncbi:receptor-type tyrosine-protein phosphatase C-like [Channa argus]|uniref:receptor-type tyrosine-protein phosphatase C-like n=1 Tax=Channa argus TaxID=215402 RepID=UPI003521B327
MAGLCNVKTLIFLAWIICQINTTAWGNNRNTVKPKTPTTSTQCSYTVTPIKFGFWINITGSTNGNYSINITEEGQREIRSSVVYFAHQTSHELKQLKPCTEYEHNVAFIESDGRETPCQKTEKKTRTNAMNTGDIQVNNCRPGYVCYQSDWDISFSLSSSNHVSSERCTSDDKRLCIKLGNNDYCSDLTTTFTSGSCSLSLTTSITVDYINPSDIFPPPPTKLPAQIVPEFPINCRSLSIDYTCSDELNKPKKLTDLEPFTDYICTGQIKNNNVNINKTTTVRFRVDCDLTIINTKNRQTNTSIELSWDTTSQNCPDVPELKNLSYTCSCTDSTQKVTITADKHPSGGTCHFTGLQPFTSYTCKVQPTYNNKDVSETKEVTVKTEPGIPDIIKQLTVKLPEHNTITVECKPPLSFKGPQNLYIAHLQYDSETPVVKNGTICHFEFKHLHYLTTYKLKVTVFNGYFQTSPTTKEVSTLYNAKAVIVLIIFVIIIIISLPVVFYIIKTYRRCKQSTDDVYENIRTEPIYMNARPPACHQKRN